MSVKAWIILAVFVVFGLPTMFHLLSYSAKAGSMTPEQSAAEGAKIIAETATPWWVGPLEFLSNHWGSIGIIGILIIVGILYFVPEVRS